MMIKGTTTFVALVLLPLVVLAADEAPALAPLKPPDPPEIHASAYILEDFQTGTVLAAKNADEQLPPASLTKIMTSFIAARELASGRISLNDEVPVSVHAWQAEGSRMFIREGTSVKLGDLLQGIIVQSGNDASIAVAEYIAGSEGAFADMMNQQAQALGMTNTHYMNAEGLPKDGHHSTARDLATLTRALIRDFPEHYKLYSERTFTYNGIEQPNRNRLLWRDRTVDGVKTGHTDEAGFCLVASALRDGMRLISVVMGTDSDEARMRESQKLLAYGFRYFETPRLYEAGAPLRTAEVWYGDADEVPLGVTDPVYVTIPRGRYNDLKAETDITRIIKAPVAKGDKYGQLRVLLDDKLVAEVPLVAQDAVAEGGFFKRIWQGIYLFFRELLS
jgi:D-alanyl-D-alanine carboxypeptidase (penicillin-binding protein 5/6)